MKWNVANLLVSIFGAALNLFLLIDTPRRAMRPLLAIVTGMLVLRAVRFWLKIGELPK